MKSVALWWIFLVCGSELEAILLPFAINGILNSHFTKGTAKVDLVYFSDKSEGSKSVVESLLKIKNEITPIKVHQFVIENHEEIRLNASSIVIFDSLQNFKETAPKIVWVTRNSSRDNHLVYAPNLTAFDILTNIKDGFLIDHVSFLLNETKKSIELATSFMFTQHACRQNQIFTINKFDSKNMKWTTSEFYPKKYENLFGCDFAVFLFELEEKDKLIETVLTSLNGSAKFSTHPTTFPDSFDIRNGLLQISDEKTYKSAITYPVGMMVCTFLVPPGEPYSDLQRMFMMFDSATWIWIGITLSIGLVTIQIVNFAPKFVQNFVFGRNIQTPTLNLLSVFLTGGQIKLPRRNFARFVLILFIIWSLIIRTCHQSMYFELMQADLRKPTIQTFDELFGSNLTFYITPVVYNHSFFQEQLAMPTTRF